MLTIANVPNNYYDAINSNESDKWMKAMDSQMLSLKKNETWELVDKPASERILGVRWVYARKNNGKLKARLVVKGYQQAENIDNVYSPVAKMSTLKILLSFSCVNNLYINQLDVESAFLNGKVSNDIYIQQPQGYVIDKTKVCKLKKSLYGLKESPIIWYNTFKKFVESIGFKNSKFDSCLYIYKTEKDLIYLLVFVDDLLICSKDLKKIDLVKKNLMEKFPIKDLGEIKNYVGIDIDYDRIKGIMELNQSEYIKSLAKKYDIENSKLYDTPMETKLNVDKSENVDESIKYRNLIGELLYVSMGTRPDITYSVNYLSRYQNCFDKTHYKYAIRILKYLYKTCDLNLVYTKSNTNAVIQSFVDSDHAGDRIDRKSTSGILIRVNGNLVVWKTKKQNVVTKCSTFAEYVALSDAVTEILFIRNLYNEMFEPKIVKPIDIFEDNSGAVSIAKYGNFTKNSKYIKIQYHYINENYENKIINIVKVKSEENLADILTKALSREKFENLREKLNLK